MENSAINSICDQLQQLSESNYSLEIEGLWKTYQKKWEKAIIQTTASEAHIEKYNCAYKLYNEKKDKFETENAKQLEAISQKALSLCEKIEHCIDDVSHSSGELKNIVNEWHNLESESKNDIILQNFSARFKNGCNQYYEIKREYFENKDWEEWAGLSIREHICREAAAIAIDEKTNYDHLFEQLQLLNDKWKKTKCPPGVTSDQLWNEFKSIVDPLYEKIKEFHKLKEEEKNNNLVLREVIISKIKTITQQKEWKNAVKDFEQLREEWKKIGNVPFDKHKAIHSQFFDVCKDFFQERKNRNKLTKEEFNKNTHEKEALIEKVLSLNPQDPWDQNLNSLKEINDQWKKIGMVSIAKRESLWNDLQKARNDFFTKCDSFRDQNYDKKLALYTEISEIVDNISTAKSATSRVKQIQDNWHKIGPVPEDKKDLANSFNKKCNEFYKKFREGKKKQSELEEANLAAKKALIIECENILKLENNLENANSIKELQKKWMEIGPVPSDNVAEIKKAYENSFNLFFENRREHFKELDSQREKNGKIKIDICNRLTVIAKTLNVEQIAENNLSASLLQIAFEMNKMFAQAQGPKAKWDLAKEEIKKLQDLWKKTGPAPRAIDEELWKTYKKYTSLFYRPMNSTPHPNHKR